MQSGNGWFDHRPRAICEAGQQDWYDCSFRASDAFRNSAHCGGALPQVQEKGNFFIPSAYFCFFFVFALR